MLALFYDATSDTFQIRTRRYERERESLAHVVVPDWPPLDPRLCDDAAVSLKHYIESAWERPTRQH